MARPKKDKKDKKIEAPEESLDAVLSPGYTLEVQQELTIVGPSESESEEAPETSNEIRNCLIGFNTVQNSNSFEPFIQMIIRFEDFGTRKLESKYSVENLMDSMSLGVKIDAYERVKQTQDRFSFHVDIQAVRDLSKELTQDFSKFYNELRANGIILKNDLNVQLVSLGIHNHRPIAAQVELIR